MRREAVALLSVALCAGGAIAGGNPGWRTQWAEDQSEQVLDWTTRLPEKAGGVFANEDGEIFCTGRGYKGEIVPPLVTPASQIVGVQSVLNVLSGKRYSMVTDETKRYAAGYYGRTPAKIDPKLQKKLCGGLKPISCRPADLLKPGLVAAAEELPPNTIQSEEDILSYALFPEVALGYFKWRNADPKDREPIPADVEEAKRVAGEATAAAAAIMVEGNAKPSAAKVNGAPVLAPLNGTFYRSDAPGKPRMAEDGAVVKTGQTLCVIEAMKLFNPIKASAAGKIIFLVEHGKAVTKGQVIASIA